MKAAQVAVAVLIGVLIAAGTVLLVFDSDDAVIAWIMLGLGLFGYFALLAMVLAGSAGTVSDEPPQQPPPETPTAAEAAQARDTIEEAARAVYTAALVWYVLHGEDEPDDDSQIMHAARLLANRLLRALRKQSATPPPLPTGEARGRWVDQQAAKIVKEAVSEAGSHYSSVFKRVRKDDPQATDRTVKATFADDTPWAHAAARTTATRLAAETVLSMRGDVERITGEDHSAMWISRGDPKVRSLHRDLHGRVRPVGDPFHTWPTGQSLELSG